MAAEPYDRYTLTSRIIHWGTAALVIANPIVAFAMDQADSRDVFLAHAGIGASVLALTIFRIFWRVGRPWPALPAGMKPWEKLLARTTHVLFYPLLIAVPLLGLATASTREGAAPITIFGFVPLPQLPVLETDAAHDQLALLHAAGVIALLLLALIHAAGAIVHTYFQPERVLDRMWPGASVPRAQVGKPPSPR